MPGDPPADLQRDAWAATGKAAERRLAFIKGILARKPEAKPGTKYIYSNESYTIAGVTEGEPGEFCIIKVEAVTCNQKGHQKPEEERAH